MNRRVASLCTGLLVSLTSIGSFRAFAADTPGANPNARDESGRTPVMWAAARDQLSILKDLLDKGADPNLQDKNGVSTLTVAACRRDPRITQILLAKGADPNKRTNFSYFGERAANSHTYRGVVRNEHGCHPD